MSEGTDKIRKWADDQREQAQAIRFMAGGGEQNAHSALSRAQAEMCEATAAGWDEIATAADEAE